MGTPIVVDCHSHVFNAEDLPVDGFIRRLSPLPSLLTGVFSKPLDRLTQWVAPGSAEMQYILDRLGGATGTESLAPAAPPGAELLSDEELDARLVAMLPIRAVAEPALETVAAPSTEDGSLRALEGAIAEASPEQRAELDAWLADVGQPAVDEPSSTVGQESLSPGALWAQARAVRGAAHRYLALLRLATRHRHLIAAELATTYPEVSLFVPALVDFSHTARDVPATDVPTQITIHSLLAKMSITGRIPGAPDARFHPMVGYCPHREVATSELNRWEPTSHETNPYIPYADLPQATTEDHHHPGMRYDPSRARSLRQPSGPWHTARLDLGGVERSLDLVRHAVEVGGFVGVKLYPPAGYLPMGNVARFGERVGGRLDAALRALYSYCEVEQVPVLTHAAFSVGFEDGYADLAAPTGWAAVLADHPELRLCFGHFGHLHGTGPDGTPGPASWPYRFMELIDQYPHVYADIGNSHVAAADAYRGRFIRLLSTLLGPRDSEEPVHLARRRRVMFGSDFWMNLTGPNHRSFLAVVDREVEAMVGETARRDFMGANALRWLGLTGEDDEPDLANRNRRRLVDFYGDHPLPSWLEHP